jgi:hypothetical protein
MQTGEIFRSNIVHSSNCQQFGAVIVEQQASAIQVRGGAV